MAVMEHPSGALSYERFVTEHDQLLRRFVARKLRSIPNDVEDALQEGLVRIWRQYHDWPADLDPGRRLAYAYKLLAHASDDILRRRFGRDGTSARRGDHLIDFRVIEIDEEYAPRVGVIAQVREHLAAMNDALEADDVDDELLERRAAALHAALAALTPLQQQVFFAHHRAGGDRNGKDVAAELQISHQKVRTEYMEARATVGPLFAHALAPDLPAEERDRVLAYSAGEMTNWRDKARMKRHLAHCDKCRALLDSERAVVGAGAHLLLPLPAVLGLAKAATASAAAAAAAGVALSEGAGGGVLSGLAAKLATGAALLAAAAGTTVAVQHSASAGGSAPAAPELARTPTATAATPAPSPTATPAATAQPKRRRATTKRRRTPRASPVQREFAPTAVPARSTPTAGKPTAAKIALDPPPSTREPASSEFGGEFAP